MKRGLALALTLALAGSSGAQTSGGNQLPNRLPIRGNMRARTAISLDNSHQALQKIFPTLEDALFQIQQTQLDFLGMSDYSCAMQAPGLPADMWLAYRGALDRFAGARPQLTPVPGFEWDPSGGATTSVLKVSVFGADHPVAAGTYELGGQGWPAIRSGHLVPYISSNPAAVDLSYLSNPQPAMLTTPGQLYYAALALPATANPLQPAPSQGSNPLAQEPPLFGSYPPLESIWGRPSANLTSSMTLDSASMTLAETLLQQGLIRIGNLSDQITRPTAAYPMVQQLQSMLASGFPTGTPATKIPLPTGFRPQEPLLNAASTNVGYQTLYAEYYSHLNIGINLFRSYGSGSMGGVSQANLEQSRTAWMQGNSDQLLQLRPLTAYNQWSPLMLDWLNTYDPTAQGPIVAQLNQLDQDPTWAADLDPTLLTSRPLTRTRVALMEVSHGQSFLTANVPNLRGFYDLALRNGWQVAPSSGSDNTGLLSAPSNGQPVPRARSSFVGLYPGDPGALASNASTIALPSDPVQRMRTLLQGFQQRRTFVSENPYVDALFYAKDSGGQITYMGSSLFQGGSGGDKTVDLVVQLNLQPNPLQTTRIRVMDIRLVEVAEQEHLLIPNGASNPLRIVDITRGRVTPLPNQQQLSQLLVDEYPLVPYPYTAQACSVGTGVTPGVPAMLNRYGLQGAAAVGAPPAAVPGASPPPIDTRPLPFTATSRITVRPHVQGGTICYYVEVHLTSAGMAPVEVITAPIWTVSNWTNFQPLDATLQ